ALWFRTADPFTRRGEILRAIDARLRLDPYATVDVVICPDAPFPLDLLDLIRGRLRDAPQSYVSRVLAHRGEDLQRRIAVVLRGDFDRDWIDALRVPVFREQTAAQALRDAEKLGAELAGARIVGPADDETVAALARAADADFVAFADRELEAAWQRRILGFGDAR